MTNGTEVTDLRYPIGKYRRPPALTPEEREQAIAAIAAAPERLRAAVAGLTPAQLDTPYRPGGWTVRQLVHHMPDSHLNAYTRFKLAVTEEAPTVRAYDEGRWAALDEASHADPEVSLALLEALHRRWVLALRTAAPEDWARTLHNPESGTFRLDQLLALYAWHGRHHVAHILALRERQGW